MSSKKGSKSSKPTDPAIGIIDFPSLKKYIHAMYEEGTWSGPEDKELGTYISQHEWFPNATDRGFAMSLPHICWLEYKVAKQEEQINNLIVKKLRCIMIY